ncbi:MAG: ParB/RepB/Spo0J family partition protein [Lachnospiraceae bacterium]|nr:ParB/RepB/Spo0J family partition protein [Lachnospiraceae bacterium]
MAEKKRPGQQMKLQNVEEILGVVGEERALEIDISQIKPFKDHPFKVVDDAKMDDLVNSIKLNGVLTPVIVRPSGRGYEMISGHRRMHAATRAGLTTIPAISREMDDDTATIVMVEANDQREEVLPSEKAFAYKMKYDALKSQGARSDLTSYQVGTKLRADEEVARMVGESKNQVYRYMRLTDLIQPLLDLVDTKKMPLATAVEVSYLDKDTQEYLALFIRDNGMVKSYQIAALRKYLAECKIISKSKMEEVLQEGFNAKTMPKSITIPEKKLKYYFSSNYSLKDMEKIIYRLLDDWKAKSDAFMKKHAQEEGGNADEV